MTATANGTQDGHRLILSEMIIVVQYLSNCFGRCLERTVIAQVCSLRTHQTAQAAPASAVRKAWPSHLLFAVQGLLHKLGMFARRWFKLSY